MRWQIRAQEREIRMLQRAGVRTASAELLRSRMRAKIDDLCRERDMLKNSTSIGTRRSEPLDPH
jgi:predicted amino acid racemase